MMAKTNGSRNGGGSTVYQLEGQEKICILPRLSLSELIHLNGLVRTICERSTDVMLLAKRDHVRPIRNLYGDIPHLRFHFVDTWEQVYGPGPGPVRDSSDADADAATAAAAVAPPPSMLERMERQGYNIVPLASFRESCPYTMMGLPDALAETSFRVTRTLDAESALLDRVRSVVGTVYAVVHDDEDRRIRRHLIPEGLTVVNVRDPRFRRANAFDWIQVLDHAVQLHAIDSCFLLMADMLSLRCRKFCHAYPNPSAHTRSSAYRDVITVWG